MRLTVQLKQHTPLIHFQWQEKGATLRPTELKSKLDKWLIAKLVNSHGLSEERLKSIKEGASEKYKKWLKGHKKKEAPAFDYKVSVQAYGENTFEDVISPELIQKNDRKRVVNTDFPTFFGNQMSSDEYEKNKKKVKRLTYSQGIRVVFDSIYEDLIEKIKEELPVFLLHTNFGTRQSKGFGSFFITTSDPLFKEKKWNDHFFTKEFDYYFDIEVQGDQEREIQKNLFLTIDMFYKTLRGGINPNDKYRMYFKPMIWKYAKERFQCQWEKKTIKQIYPDIKSGNSYSDQNSPQNWEGNTQPVYDKQTRSFKQTHLLWRDVLGLSSIQKWGGKGSIEKVNGTYKRFASPIFFKPLRTGEKHFRIFFEVPTPIKEAFRVPASDIPETAILGEWFDIIRGYKDNKHTQNKLRLPVVAKFDFDAFFEDAFSTCLISYVEDGKDNSKYPPMLYGKRINSKKEEKDNPDFLKLNSIYRQLHFQLNQKKGKNEQ